MTSRQQPGALAPVRPELYCQCKETLVVESRLFLNVSLNPRFCPPRPNSSSHLSYYTQSIGRYEAYATGQYEPMGRIWIIREPEPRETVSIWSRIALEQPTERPGQGALQRSKPIYMHLGCRSWTTSPSLHILLGLYFYSC